jgi:hypothetical protein
MTIGHTAFRKEDKKFDTHPFADRWEWCLMTLHTYILGHLNIFERNIILEMAML